MKKILLTTLAITALVLAIKYGFEHKLPGSLASGPCSDEITYSVGIINPIYNLKEQELKEILKDIGGVWSQTTGKNLFKHSKDGNITVNIIYDEQQQFLNKEQSASSRIRLEKLSFKTAEDELLRFQKRYEQKKNEYDGLIEKYNRLRKSPALKTTRGKLERKAEEINQTRNELNDLGSRINEKAAVVNRISSRIEQMIADYNKSYSSPQEFNQGNYQKTIDGEMINIYSYGDLDELRLVLAHEMGHALGLQHVQNSKSVMYYLMQNQQTDSLAFTKEDIIALKSRCGANNL